MEEGPGRGRVWWLEAQGKSTQPAPPPRRKVPPVLARLWAVGFVRHVRPWGLFGERRMQGSRGPAGRTSRGTAQTRISVQAFAGLGRGSGMKSWRLSDD